MHQILSRVSYGKVQYTNLYQAWTFCVHGIDIDTNISQIKAVFRQWADHKQERAFWHLKLNMSKKHAHMHIFFLKINVTFI